METGTREGQEWALRLTPWILGVLAATLYIPLLFQYVSHSPFAAVPVVDADYYWKTAINTAVLGKPLPGLFFSAPLYPLLLTALVFVLGPGLPLLYGVQLLAAALTVFLIAGIGRQVFTPMAGLLAGILSLLYFPLAFYALKLFPEVWSLLLLSLFLYLFTHPRWPRRFSGLILLGLAGGLCVLVRSQFIPIVGVLIFFLPFYTGRTTPGRDALRVGSVLLVALIPVGLWGGHTLARTGALRISAPNGGVTLYEGNNPNARGTYTPIPGLTNDINGQLAGMVAVAGAETGRTVTVGDADRYFRQKALDYIRSNPLEWLSLECTKAWLAVRPRETGLIYNLYMERSRHLSVGWLFPVNWGFLMLFSLVAVIHLVPSYRRGLFRALPLLYTGAVLFAFLLAFFVVTRYRILLLPVAAVLAGQGLILFGGWVRGKRYAPLLILAGITLGTFILSFSGTTSIQAQNNLAFALIHSGRFEEAEAASREVLAEHPHDPVAVNNLVTSLWKQDRIKEAAPLIDWLAANPLFSENAAVYRRALEDKRTRDQGK